MTYEDWESSVPSQIRGDVVWKVKAYRLALFLSDLSWADAGKMLVDKRLLSVADQLVRACGSAGAHIAEGYSRGTGRDRVRFYEYSLGSLREARHWYYQGRRQLDDDVLGHRYNLLEEAIKLLLAMISRDRRLTRKFD